MTTASPAPARGAVFWAFAAIYLIWGSTYLGIRVVVLEAPPFLAAGARFLAAGGVLYAWARWRGASSPSLPSWRWAAVFGALFFLVGNGGVSWAETRVESGLAALLAATSPVWTVALESAFGGWKRPPLRVLAGVLLGLAGVAVLVAPGEFIGGAHADLAGAGAIGLAAMGWAAASVISHGRTVHPSPEMATAMKMLAGGALLAGLGVATGEVADFHPLAYSAKAWLAWGYLVVFGSVVAFSAFTFLLRVTTPAKVSTSAYVNPLVAVLLGWALLGEAISARTLVAALVIIAGVVLVRLAAEEPAEP